MAIYLRIRKVLETEHLVEYEILGSVDHGERLTIEKADLDGQLGDVFRS